MSTRSHIQDCIACTGEVLALARRAAQLWGNPRRFSANEMADVMAELSVAVRRADAHDARLDALLVAALEETDGPLEVVVPGPFGADDEPTLTITPQIEVMLCLRCAQPYPCERLVTGGAGGPVCERCAARIEELLLACEGAAGPEVAPWAAQQRQQQKDGG